MTTTTTIRTTRRQALVATGTKAQRQPSGKLSQEDRPPRRSHLLPSVALKLAPVAVEVWQSLATIANDLGWRCRPLVVAPPAAAVVVAAIVPAKGRVAVLAASANKVAQVEL